MASVVDGKARVPCATSLAPDTYERALSASALALLACVLAAVIKGRARWAEIPVLIWPHLLTIAVAVALTPVMLLRPRGTPAHCQLGWVWVIAMFATAFLSLLVRNANHGGFSFIHILSAWTMIQVPIIVWSAHRQCSAPQARRSRHGDRRAADRRRLYLSVPPSAGTVAVRLTGVSAVSTASRSGRRAFRRRICALAGGTGRQMPSPRARQSPLPSL